MSGKVTDIEEIRLSSARNGIISISVIEQPYGEDSRRVASIGVSLNQDNDAPDWKVHIPKENIDAVITALQVAKKSL